MNLSKSSTDKSVMKATSMISATAGIMPRTLRVNGIDMIPAPIMLVDTLNTAPETDAVSIGGFISGRRGTCSGGGDIGTVRLILK